MSQCIFCRIVAGEVPATRVYEDAQMLVFKDIHPKAPVHLLAIPKQHVESLNEIAALSDELLTHVLRALPRIASEQGLHDGFRTIVNTGPGGGQEVPHLHFHILGGGGRLPGF